MSIVTDFKDINSRLRGDDWWKPEVVAVEAPAPCKRTPIMEKQREWARRRDLPLAVGGGSCGVTTASQWTPEELAALKARGNQPLIYNGVVIRQVASLEDAKSLTMMEIIMACESGKRD